MLKLGVTLHFGPLFPNNPISLDRKGVKWSPGYQVLEVNLLKM